MKTARGQVARTDLQRRGLLAKVHIAKKDLGLSDLDYRYLLAREFHRGSARDLSVGQLEALVRLFREKGWQPRRMRNADCGLRQDMNVQRQSEIRNPKSQVEALQRRARDIAGDLTGGDARLRGLCRSVCRVDRVEWCRDVGKLKRMVAALEKIRRREDVRR